MNPQMTSIVEIFRREGRMVIADEVGSVEWEAAKRGGSKVDLIRARQEAFSRQGGEAAGAEQ